MTYFFDNNISHKIVLILKALDVDARHLKDDFPDYTEDVDWIPRAGAEGWIVVTADRAIRRRPAERAALKAANVTALFLKDNFLRRDKWQQTEWIIKHWRDIAKEAERLPQGTTVSVSDRGKLEILK